ncbi:MAG: bifunctional adenosylcobinamide kinase/adenosylcobinamide-phosphate guanylyltransferase [Chloroflexi bacterium]|nr:bifunctional adenosylcobinamide kinase/adenosylcobinamide-phosphate guanylyltransferase [Chloroflexota bacterium]
MAKELILILGGARAGKSSLAEHLAEQLSPPGGRVLFVATAQAGDEDMARRIAAHKVGRPAAWDTLEEPLELPRALGEVVQAYDAILIDCLTLWVSNLLLQEEEETAESRALDLVDRLLALYQQGRATWIVVTNEVGFGVVPPTALGRAFRDILGRVNQRFAAQADRAYLVVAGLALDLKAPGATLPASTFPPSSPPQGEMKEDRFP